MKYTKNIIIIFVLLISGNIAAQSRYLENGIGGSCFQIKTDFDSTGLTTLGLSAAYSIGGIMDIGFQVNREEGTILSFPRIDWSFDFLYNIIVIKQTEYIPISLQLEGSYGYTNISSEYLTNSDLAREGQGFRVGVSLFREFNQKGLFSFLIGGEGSYRNYLYTETDFAHSTTSTEKSEKLIFGGIAGVSLRPEKWPIFTIEVQVLYNQTDNELFIQPSLLIISPSY